MRNYASIQSAELTRAMQSGEVIVLDVRASKDFERQHIKSSINIPVDELEDNLLKLPVKKRLVLVCRDGHLARKAACQTVKMGRDKPYILDGGILSIAKDQLEGVSTTSSAKTAFTFYLSTGCVISAGMLSTAAMSAPLLFGGVLALAIIKSVSENLRDEKRKKKLFQ